jgi:hypothetical protein
LPLARSLVTDPFAPLKQRDPIEGVRPLCHLPLHAGIQEQCRRIGFSNLAPIIWNKIVLKRLTAFRDSKRIAGEDRS